MENITDKSQKQNNLLIIHLESLNLINYNLHRELFPFLYSMQQKCITFDRYYSTATSTLMVVGDLMYGRMDMYECCDSLDFIPDSFPCNSSLFDDLKGRGYNTGIFVYPDGGDRESAEKRHIAGFDNEMKLISSYDDYLQAFEDIINEEVPFALMSCNYISNVAQSVHVNLRKYDIASDKWSGGFAEVDRCSKDLVNMVEKAGKLENTVIIFYGDHGDDYWGHGMHQGLVHAIEPTEQLIHTPFFIWDGKMRKSDVDCRLIGSTDIRGLTMHLTIGESVEDYPLEHQFLFARNEYACQPVRADSFNKSYSVTDGRYMLIVSAKGLQFHDTYMDPFCNTNILKFYKGNNNGILEFKADCKKIYMYHFPGFFDDHQQMIFRRKYYRLLKELKSKVEELFAAGGREREEVYEEMYFGISKV